MALLFVLLNFFNKKKTTLSHQGIKTHKFIKKNFDLPAAILHRIKWDLTPTASRQNEVVPFVGPARPDLYRIPVYDKGLRRFEGKGGAERVPAVSVEIAKAFKHVSSGKAVRNAVGTRRRDGPRLGRLLAFSLRCGQDERPGIGGAARLADRPVDFGKRVGRRRPKDDRGIRQGVAGRVENAGQAHGVIPVIGQRLFGDEEGLGGIGPFQNAGDGLFR